MNSKKFLAISIVCYEWNLTEITKCLISLKASIESALSREILGGFHAHLLYNGPEELKKSNELSLINELMQEQITIYSEVPNTGYGGTNNKVINHAIENNKVDYLLVMNPDVLLEEDTITTAIQTQTEHADCGFSAPLITDPINNANQYGNKRFPSIALLIARAFPYLYKISYFYKLNYYYEYRDVIAGKDSYEVELCSGCFLFAKIKLWRDISGFDDGFFMYFEDFDACIRASKSGWKHIYNPLIKVFHSGGNTSKKPAKHKLWFVSSAVKFYRKHGLNYRSK